MFTHRSGRPFRLPAVAAIGALVLLTLTLPVAAAETGAPLDRDTDSAGGRTGVPTGLRSTNPNFVEECGYLINLRSWDHIKATGSVEHPAGHVSNPNPRGPSFGKLFLGLHLFLFRINVDPCP